MAKPAYAGKIKVRFEQHFLVHILIPNYLASQNYILSRFLLLKQNNEQTEASNMI